MNVDASCTRPSTWEQAGDDELCTVAGVELGEEPADMGLYGIHRDCHSVGALVVRRALSDQAQCLDLAAGEAVNLRRPRARRGRR